MTPAIPQNTTADTHACTVSESSRLVPGGWRHRSLSRLPPVSDTVPAITHASPIHPPRSSASPLTTSTTPTTPAASPAQRRILPAPCQMAPVASAASSGCSEAISALAPGGTPTSAPQKTPAR
ncbi:hypothetical protein GCM10022202_17990 [Microbacterium marinilacus]|uniref:Uncharacterized protein n=1 Tax=Microbacterium marinilacus TaxID=415209 RepID=A0ABP7BE17_9MICO